MMRSQDPHESSSSILTDFVQLDSLRPGVPFEIRAVKSRSRAQAQSGPLEGKFGLECSHGLLLSLHQMEVRTRSQGRSVSGQAAK